MPQLSDDPFGYGVIGVILAICIRLLWVLITDLRERADKLQAALDEERKATMTALEIAQELKEVGRLLRRVLEGLPRTHDDRPRTRQDP